MRVKKWLVPLIYFLFLAAAYIFKDDISLLLQHRPSWLLMLMLAVLLATFPIMPYKLVIAAAGLLYGPWIGALLTIAGSTLSGILLYAAGSFWYRKDAGRWFRRFPYLERFSSYVRDHPFESVLLYRLLPIVPQGVLNLYAGAAPIPFRIYLIASVIGKLPGVLVYAYLGSSLFSRPLLAAGVLGLYAVFVLAAVWGYRRKNARRTG